MLTSLTLRSVATYPDEGVTISGLQSVNGSRTFNDCNVVMGKDAKIIVKQYRTLNIYTLSHFYACDEMWNSISVANGGQVRVQGGSIIEDAVFGTYVERGAFYSITDSYYNRNQYQLVVFNAAGSPVFGSGTVSNTQFRSQTTASLLTPTPVYENLLPPNASAIPTAAIYGSYAGAMDITGCGVSNSEYGFYLEGAPSPYATTNRSFSLALS